MNTSQQRKRKFRQSKKWKDFRKRVRNKQNNLDYITNKKLLPKANLHHMLLDESKYEDISNEDNFLFVNSSTHKFLHWAYRYYKDDKKILERLEIVLHKMLVLNT